jgi:hypothetical protein
MNNLNFDGINVYDVLHLIRLDMDELYWNNDKNQSRLYHDLGFLLLYGIELLENNIKIWSWKWLSKNGKLCDYVYSPDFHFYDQIREAGCTINDYQIKRR